MGAALLALAIFSPSAFALDLGETVLMIPKPGVSSVSLETTLYKPQGSGPFPLAVINHGKSPGNPKLQSRYRPLPAVSYFLQRGYAVAVPMRQGFGNSTGNYVSSECNLERNGLLQAEDIAAVLNHLVTLPYVNKERVVVVGQSHGGLATLALGAKKYPGVVGLINFAGGLRQQNCPSWEAKLAHAASAYAKHTSIPSVWFYGDNDSYFPPSTYNQMYERYRQAGGQARLVSFGKFGTDAHAMFGSRRGENIWQPEVTRFLGEIGLPTNIVYPQYSLPPPMDVPLRTDYADLDNIDAVPHLKEKAKTEYREFLKKDTPRAFAIAPNGAYGWAVQGDDPLRRALENCQQHAPNACRLYVVDDYVVWPKSSPTVTAELR
jgi:dienelactone hydrolase